MTARMRAEHPFRREATPARKDVTGPADQRLRMVEPTVLQTATINVLTCGLCGWLPDFARIRQMITRPRVWQGHGQIAAAPMAAGGELIPRVRGRDGRHGPGRDR